MEALPNQSSNVTQIIVVEDDSLVRQFVDAVLRMNGYQTTLCMDAESGLEELNLQVPVLLLTDCRLPGMSGIDLIKIVSERFPSVPVIGMSGEHFKGRSMLDAGAEAFLPKPMTAQSIGEMAGRFARGLPTLTSSVGV